MSPHVDPRTGQLRVLSVAVLAPLERWGDLSLGKLLVAALAGTLQLVVEDVLSGALVLLVASGAIDYYLGRARAKRSGRYDPAVAHAGALVKISGLLILCLVRGFEWWAAAADIVQTRGWIAAALAIGLFLLDVESIEHHRVQLGARPIPGFSRLTRWLQVLEERLLPAPAVERVDDQDGA